MRAALAIQRALTELNRINADTSRPALAACITIDFGPVVIDAAGEIFGDLPNVIAQAQVLAEPGTVVVTAQVQRQVAGLFTTEELARISHNKRRIGAANQRKLLCCNDFRGIRREPRCRQSVARNALILEMSKIALWKPRLMAAW